MKLVSARYYKLFIHQLLYRNNNIVPSSKKITIIIIILSSQYLVFTDDLINAIHRGNNKSLSQ